MSFTFLIFSLAVCITVGKPIENVLQNDCLLIFSETQFEDGSTESQVECDLRGEDLQGSYHKIVKVDGLTVDLAQTRGVESGFTTLFSEKAVIDSSGSLLEIPANGEIQLTMTGEDVSNRNLGGILNRKLQSGTRTVLVLRAVASDASTTASEPELSDDIFGTSGDVLNLKSQYASCSDGKLQFQPLTTNTIVGEDGVYTVNLPSTTVTGATRETIRDAMINQAATDLGASLDTIADHVLVCIPPGTANSWIGSGTINHWRSMYNDNWCRYPSLLLHEVGHNLNLDHSGEGVEPYGDKSCLMAVSYQIDEGHLMCFNGAKTYQLGWYSQHHLDLPFNGSFNWNGNLIGYAEKASASLSDKMIVRIITSTKDIYIHFNRKIGMNIGTQEGGDQVLVATRVTGIGYAASDLVAKLSVNGIYTVSNFNGSGSSLTIQVNSIITGTVPGQASISIQFETPTPTNAPTSDPTLGQVFLPTGSPMQIPTPVPTGQPSNAPAMQPTSVPTSFPTSMPTFQPTNAPTMLPVNVLTGQPTSNPTSMPTSVPTSTPTTTPTIQPTSFPTMLSVNVPTGQPTSIPTSKPTSILTSQPTKNPTTSIPTSQPTSAPANIPTMIPTASIPTNQETNDPTNEPISLLTSQPLNVPTGQPTNTLTITPTLNPTNKETSHPTKAPTLFPSTSSPLSVLPTTKLPTAVVSRRTPTRAPTATKPPTKMPSKLPTKSPTKKPTKSPTRIPTKTPNRLSRSDKAANTYSWIFF